jgi:membrane protein required for colicin V production
MLIDVIAFMLLLLAMYKGFSKGLIIAVFSFLAFIIGLAAALKLSAAAAAYIGSTVNISQRWLPVLAFIGVFIIVALLIRVGAKMLEGMVTVAMLGWLNRLGGMVFYVLIYFFIYSIVLFYADQLKIIKPESAKASIVYPYLRPMAPCIMKGIGVVIPAFKNMFQQLLQFFDGVSEKNTAAQYSLLLLITTRKHLR